MLTITPINDAEAIVARFFDPMRRHLEWWQQEISPTGAGNRFDTNFQSLQCRWGQGQAMRASLGCDTDLPVGEYTHLMLCLQSSASTRVTVLALVDGQERVVIDRAPGRDSGQELEGALSGAHLSRLTIILEDPAQTIGLASLFWLGLFHAERRQRLRARVEHYRHAWDDLLLPAGDIVANPTPVLGLHFGADDLEALRRKAASPTWAPVMARLRAAAREHLTSEPWRGVGPTWNNYTVRDGRMENNTQWISWPAMRLGAFVGLLDNDPALLRMALNHALAAAHCEVWHPTFMSGMAGSSWEGRAFFEYRTAINLVFAWDWAGAYLTPAGRAVLAQALSIKGLSWCLQTLMRHPYVRGCNQGVFFAYGAIVSELALAKTWHHGGELLGAARQALDQTVTQYYAADGGTFEGIGYATGTLAQALAAYSVLARHLGQPLADLVPPVVGRIPNYLMTMLSTQPPYGAVIKTADGGRAGACVVSASLGCLCHLSDDPGIPALLAGLNQQVVSPGYYLGDELNLIVGPEILPAPTALPPIFRILEQTGMLCSCRPTPAGPVRLQLIGGPAKAGHCHDDRASIVLEAFGEEIAIDRGQMPYADPRCDLLKAAQYHNVLTVDAPDGSFLRQRNPCPQASIPTGHGDATRLDCAMDASAALPAPGLSWQRQISSDTPCVFLVTDSVTLESAAAVSFHLHSRFPWQWAEDAWVTRGERSELRVVPQWPTVSAWGREDFVDGLKAPAYHLALTAAPATTHHLLTRLEVRPLG